MRSRPAIASGASPALATVIALATLAAPTGSQAECALPGCATQPASLPNESRAAVIRALVVVVHHLDCMETARRVAEHLGDNRYDFVLLELDARGAWRADVAARLGAALEAAGPRAAILLVNAGDDVPAALAATALAAHCALADASVCATDGRTSRRHDLAPAKTKWNAEWATLATLAEKGLMRRCTNPRLLEGPLRDAAADRASETAGAIQDSVSVRLPEIAIAALDTRDRAAAARAAFAASAPAGARVTFESTIEIEGGVESLRANIAAELTALQTLADHLADKAGKLPKPDDTSFSPDARRAQARILTQALGDAEARAAAIDRALDTWPEVMRTPLPGTPAAGMDADDWPAKWRAQLRTVTAKIQRATKKATASAK